MSLIFKGTICRITLSCLSRNGNSSVDVFIVQWTWNGKTNMSETHEMLVADYKK